MTEPRRRRGSTKASFGDSAPPNTIPFPKQAKMTVVEILAFLPNCINCPDVVYRMISNGGTRKSIHAIINTHREFDVEWSANCCGEAMYKTMEQGGYTEWTVKKHSLWHDGRKESWDEDRLDVGHLRTAPNGPAVTVSFRRLAENVRTMPEGDDALDLTRMVSYCVQNAGEGWRYPTDYEELLDLLGGPAKAEKENTDGAVFGRWEHRKPPPPTERSPQGMELLEEWETIKTKKSRRCFGRDTRSRPVSASTSLLAERRAAWKNMHDVAGNTSVEVNDDSQLDHGRGTPYVRAPVSTDADHFPGLKGKTLTVDKAEFVPPPSQNANPFDLPTLTQVFQAEGFAGEWDMYSAYAFGGPRGAPPYRSLHQIAQPHPWDSSGWAENLRWAFEQRVLFAQEHPDVAGWDESPEHVARIERERTQLVWASDELLDQLLESE
ncbi:hypothetical protein SVAN01_04901 [Stagonosporopsis vannaccii]|nr:hypothetical protein SVAN01_04901 [Stagonosporopsis vannaccii]